MSTKKPYLLLVSGILIFCLSCKKQIINTTGNLAVQFLNGVPSCLALYTEYSYNNYRLPLYNNSTSSGGIVVNTDLVTETVTFKDLNAGNYVVQDCSSGHISLVQVSAGMEKSYKFQ